jgi:3-keto-disaccharide hydrolase
MSGLWEEATMKRLTAVIAGILVFGAGLAGCASGPMGGGWVTLFDGSDLKHWYTVGDGNWRLEGGLVVADKKTGKDNGFLVSNEIYRDFELKVEFWVSDDANSGIYMRCGNPEVLTDKICYEANIFDQRKEPAYGTGGLVHIGKVDPMPKAGGKWNTYEISVKGNHIVLVLNGVKTVDVNDDKLHDGRIGLQYAAGVVKFRKVLIRPL